MKLKSQRDGARDFVDIFEDVVQFLFLFFRPLFTKISRSSHRLFGSLKFEQILFRDKRKQSFLNFSLPFAS